MKIRRFEWMRFYNIIHSFKHNGNINITVSVICPFGKGSKKYCAFNLKLVTN